MARFAAQFLGKLRPKAWFAALDTLPSDVAQA